MSGEQRTRVVATHGLRSIDAATIRIFMNFVQGHTRHTWTLGDVREAELLVLQRGVLRPELLDGALTVWVDDTPGVTPGPALVRPLQLEAFVELLQAMERGVVAPVPAPAAAPEASAEEGGDTVAMPLHADTEPSERLPSAPAPASQAAPAASIAPAVATPPSPLAHAMATGTQRLRFRLKRWPSASSLSAHRYLPRLASFLSARHLNVFELSELSNVSEAECEAFLSDMEAQGILDRVEVMAVPSAAALVAAPAAMSPPAAPPATAPGQDSTFEATTPMSYVAPSAPVARPALLGIVGRLRARLGLN